jgi:hypothetical protein
MTPVSIDDQYRRDTEESLIREKSPDGLPQSWDALFSGVAKYSKRAAHAAISRIAWEDSLNRRLVGG